MRGLYKDTKWRVPRVLRKFDPGRTKILEPQCPISRRSSEEAAVFASKLAAAFKVHEYRMQTDPVYRKLKLREQRKFDLYMFFHDRWTFKRYLFAPAKYLWRRCRVRFKKE